MSIPHIQIGDVQVTSSTDVRNLGVIFDQCMTLEKHVCRVCQISYMHLRRIAKIRHLLSKQAAEQLIHAFITSRLDFCNNLLTGLPQSTLNRLQSVQNAAACLLTGTRKFDHITPILYKLHWLPVNQRIQFKIIILTFKALHGSAPPYMHDLLTHRTTRPGLRSIRNTLHVPRTRLVSYGDRAYSNIAPRLWNSLPDYLRQIHNITLFQQKLKTHLFLLAFQHLDKT